MNTTVKSVAKAFGILGIVALVLVVAVVTIASGSSSPTPLEQAEHLVAESSTLKAKAEGSATKGEAAVAASKETVTQAATVKGEAEALALSLRPAEPPKEEPKEPPTGAAVSATPAGPPAPAAGWKVAYADAFAAPIGGGAGEDNTWVRATNDQGCCGNSNELNIERPSQATTGPEGLKLKCEYLATEVLGKRYNCGGVRGAAARSPQISYKGETLAVEWKGKLPPNLGTADPGVWQDGGTGQAEFDYPEVVGWGKGCGSGGGWSTCWGYYAWFFSPHPELVKQGFGGEPENREHTYTTYMFPTSGGKYRYSVYVDGVRQNLSGVEQSPEVTPESSVQAHLIVTYALRAANVANKFTSGSNTFTVRSLAVYEDAGHSSVVNEGVAPGTTVK